MFKEFKHLSYSVSYTTRQPRGSEIDGKDYHFINIDDFKDMISGGDFLEWEEVHGNYYGTSKSGIENALSIGSDVFLDIDPKGAMHLKSKIKEAVFIFIVAPSFYELRERLIKRGSDSNESIEIRMNNAKKELEYLKNYDYLIINDKSDRAFEDMKAIYIAEKLKTKRIQENITM